MSRKRSDIEISADILRVAKGGARKSHIVYRANLNFDIVMRYLDQLRGCGLITGPSGDSRLFRTTERGLKFIDSFESFRDYMKQSDLYS